MESNLAFLALGSTDSENSIFYLEETINRIEEKFKIQKISSIFKTPSLYKDSQDIGIFYNNCVLSIDAKEISSADELLKEIIKIENEILQNNKKTSESEKEKTFKPRDIDIDILIFKNLEIDTEKLKIPHYQMFYRSFVLDPLSQIEPYLKLKEKNIEVFKRRKELNQKQPLLMSIVNFTKDSFSDGGVFFSKEALKQRISEEIKNNTHILDIGAQSVSENRRIISEEEEIERYKEIIQTILEEFKNSKRKHTLPKISIDSFRANVIDFIIKNGLNVDYFNDVSGLNFEEKEKIEVLKKYKNLEIIIMHNLTIPRDLDVVFENTSKMITEMKKWLELKLNLLEKNGINKDRVIFDPGIGFGKTAKDSLFLLENIGIFDEFDVRICIGHSRKSFIKGNFKNTTDEKELETLAVSNALNQKGVDFIRIHNVEIHNKFKDLYLSVMGFNNDLQQNERYWN